MKENRTRSYGLLILGGILLIASILFSVHAYNTSYQESMLVEAAAEKLALQRPYSYGLIATFLAVLMTVKGGFNAIVGVNPSKKADIRKLTQAGFLAALCYIGFTFLRIDIPVGPEKTAVHLGNTFCVLSALLVGGYWGGLSGAVGMTIADLTTAYVTSAPKTFLLKLCIGLIVGFVAHKVFKLSREHTKKHTAIATLVSCSCGMAFNIVADPLTGYFYKRYLLGMPQDLSVALAKIGAHATGVNAVIAITVASIIYLALRPAMKKAGLFVEL